MRGLVSASLREAFLTGLLWMGICIVFDLADRVLIKHPWRLTFKQFYVGYQPRLALIYLAVFGGPLVGYLLVRI